jgi:hypothetical protein
VVALPLSSCAHRRPSSTSLAAPAPPARPESGSVDRLKRADEALERLRQQLAPRSNGAGANNRRNADIARPTDAPDEPASRRPLGTTWSVVVSQPPTTPGDSAPRGQHLTRSDSAEADPPKRSRRTFDLVGGAVAALCGTLAIRKRAREARPT